MAAKQGLTNTEKAEPNTLKDQWGNERPYDKERYAEDSPARKDDITKPSGQGGASPKSRPDHQDQYPANAEPDEVTLEYAEKLARRAQGEDVDLTEHLEATSDSASKGAETAKQQARASETRK